MNDEWRAEPGGLSDSDLTPSSLLGLPRGLEDYLRAPGLTWEKGKSWLNARWQLRACTRVGRWPRVRGRIYLRNLGEIVLGDRVHLLSHYARSVFTAFPGGRLEVGDRTIINYGADIAATKLVQIGADCLIGTHVIILDNDFHELEDRDRIPEARPVMIGDRAWIGNRAIILPGVTIGEDAAVGAGSVVMTDIPPRTLAMGNPARVIKKF